LRNKIIVPVDLTPASKNAFLYAVALASELDLEVEILPMIDQHLYVEESLRENFYGFKENSLSATVASFYGDALYQEGLDALDVAVKINMIPHTLVFDKSFPKRKDVDLVIFGIEKNNRYAYRMSQNLAFEISEQFGCDALFIPVERKFMSVDSILFISDYDFADIPLLKQWEEIGVNNDAKFHFIFGTGLSPIHESKNEIYKKIFKAGIPDISFNISFFTNQELEDAIKSYIDEANIDMVVINKPEMPDLLKSGSYMNEFNRPVLISNPVILLKVR